MKGRRILVVYDEASAIPDLIWETTEGALTDANTDHLALLLQPDPQHGPLLQCFGRSVIDGSRGRLIAARQGSPTRIRSISGSKTMARTLTSSASASVVSFPRLARCSSYPPRSWRKPLATNGKPTWPA